MRTRDQRKKVEKLRRGSPFEAQETSVFFLTSQKEEGRVEMNLTESLLEKEESSRDQKTVLHVF